MVFGAATTSDLLPDTTSGHFMQISWYFEDFDDVSAVVGPVGR